MRVKPFWKVLFTNQVVLLTTFFYLFAPFSQANAQEAGNPVAVSTFHSIGVEWSPSEAAENKRASIQFRAVGSDSWITGFDLWYSENDLLYRGSLVHLEPNTEYEISLQLEGSSQTASLTSKTWNEDFPVARVVELPENSTEQLVISESGTPDGYILYTHAPGQTSTIDPGTSVKHTIIIRGSYIIIRELNIIGADVSGIHLSNGTHDVVIENNDISGWGRQGDGLFGQDDGAIDSNTDLDISRIIIQRNKLHHPRYDTNSWGEERADVTLQSWGTHPRGPQGIYMIKTGGNHVIRYNSIFSDDDHRFNDCIGGSTGNFSETGFPAKDSDIYGNYMEKCWDNGIESEGGNRNVRIWNNYITETYRPIATRDTTIGPIYIWRNISNIVMKFPKDQVSWADDPGGSFHKAGSQSSDNDHGVFEFHNTILQPQLTGVTRTVGATDGPNGAMYNTTTRNNIFHVWCSDDCFSINFNGDGTKNSFDYDLYNGSLKVPSNQMANSIFGVPTYAGTGFDQDSKTGNFSLAASSLGYDSGQIIPNFNQHLITGVGPDMGAHEAGMPVMEFGVLAYQDGEPYTVTATRPKGRVRVTRRHLAPPILPR